MFPYLLILLHVYVEIQLLQEAGYQNGMLLQNTHGNMHKSEAPNQMTGIFYGTEKILHQTDCVSGETLEHIYIITKEIPIRDHTRTK